MHGIGNAIDDVEQGAYVDRLADRRYAHPGLTYGIHVRWSNLVREESQLFQQAERLAQTIVNGCSSRISEYCLSQILT